MLKLDFAMARRILQVRVCLLSSFYRMKKTRKTLALFATDIYLYGRLSQIATHSRLFVGDLLKLAVSYICKVLLKTYALLILTFY